MSSSILVTGASGFLGRHLLAALAERGESVVTHSTSDGDLAQVQPHASGIRHVYHLAARTYVPDSWRNPQDFYQVNVLGTVNVLDYCRAQGASLTLLSSYVYGRPQMLPIGEDHPVSPFNPYGHSKYLAEEVAKFYRTNYDVRVAIVRPFNLYGPGQSEDFLIPTLIRQALSADYNALTVADSRPRRDYIYVGDLVDMLLILGQRPDIISTFNAGTGTSTSVLELAETIAELAGVRKPVISRDESRPNEVLDTIADISRARDEIGWKPKTSLREGLKHTIGQARE